MTMKAKKVATTPAKPSARKAPKAAAKALLVSSSKGVTQPKKAKRIRGRFAMPAHDYAMIGELKAASKKRGRAVKKNELLRAGLHALKAMASDALEAALAALQPAKAKPKKKAS